MTLFHDLNEMNWLTASNFRNEALSTTVFFITCYCITIWQIVVRGKKYSQQIGSREPR